MNFIRSLFAILPIFVLIEESISTGEIIVLRNSYFAPLVLFNKGILESWKLATPRASKYGDEAIYEYDDSGNSREQLKTACFAHTAEQIEMEKQWRKKYKLSKYDRLNFFENFSDPDPEKMKCDKVAVPSILLQINISDRTGKDIYGGRSEALIERFKYLWSNYLDEGGNLKLEGIKLWVSNEDGSEINFIPVYKICYSKTKKVGTLYTIHKIVSPDLMFLERHEQYEPDPLESIKTFLEDDLRKVNSIYKENYVYQFVGTYDMPITAWYWTTHFHFNFTPITKEDYGDLMNGMIAIDSYIRLFSRKKNKTLTIYSGTYETTREQPGCLGLFSCKLVQIPVKSFWKILIDAENNAIMIVTLHSLVGCERWHICPERRRLRTYKRGGCTYECEVTNEALESIGLLEELWWFIANGPLLLKFPRKRRQRSGPSLGGEESTDIQVESAPQDVDISDFMAAASFVAALNFAEGLSDSWGDSYNDGTGGNDGGHGDGDRNVGGDHGMRQ